MTREEQFNEEFIEPIIEERGSMNYWSWDKEDIINAMKWADEHPKSPWIKCSERQPEQDGEYYCYHEGGYTRNKRYVEQKYWIEVGENFGYGKVVAWMPIPEFKEE